MQGDSEGTWEIRREILGQKKVWTWRNGDKEWIKYAVEKPGKGVRKEQ